MSYIEQIFNKSIGSLQLKDLEEYFKEPQEETSILEFKSGDVEINDIFKEVAAFLNTEGGLLIIGSPREEEVLIKKNKKIICKGELTYSKFRSKDWLYQKIMSNISPPPAGIKIFEEINEKGSIFILDIPQSITPPHQCNSEGKYYIRLEREAKPAPHGIVQALFQKRRLPVLKSEINFEKEFDNSDYLTISIFNTAEVPADKVGFIIEIHNVSEVECIHDFKDFQNHFPVKHSMTKSTEQVLAQVISIPIELRVFHNKQNYIVFVGYWSKDNDFDFQYWTYDPIKGKILCSDKMNYDKTSFKEEMDKLRKTLHNMV